MIPVNLELVNELWLPNIFIYNLKTFKVGLMVMVMMTMMMMMMTMTMMMMMMLMMMVMMVMMVIMKRRIKSPF